MLKGSRPCLFLHTFSLSLCVCLTHSVTHTLYMFGP
jgi:hypothetical protein